MDVADRNRPAKAAPKSSAFGVANIFLIAGVYVYLAGWAYVQQLRYDYNLTYMSLTDIPPAQIYSYAGAVLTRQMREVIDLALLGLFCATACWRLGNAGQAFWVRVLIVGYAGYALYKSLLLATAAADDQFEVIKHQGDWTRVKFMLTPEAKHRYDRFFVALNERLRLRVLEVRPDSVLVLRLQYVYPPNTGDWHEAYYTYSVPVRDFSNAIYYTPPAADTGAYEPDMDLPPDVWRSILQCKGRRLTAFDGRAFSYTVNATGDVWFDSVGRIEHAGLIQGYVALQSGERSGLSGLTRHPTAAYRILAAADRRSSHHIGCGR